MPKENNQQHPYPIYVIAGKDAYLVSKEYETVVSSVVSDEDRQNALRSFEPDKAQIADVLDELRTLPFLASRRVVVIRDADKFITDNREHLEKYFDAPSKRGILIMTASSFPKTTKLAKKCAKVGKLITIAEIKKWDLADYAIQYANREHNKRMDKAAAQLVVDMTGDDSAMVCGEVDKLAIYVDDRDAITAKDVNTLCGNNREFDIFEMIEQMTKGNTAAAVQRLRNMFATDKNAEYTVVGGLAFHFRRMFKARAMMDNGISSFDIAKNLNIWGDRNAYFAQLRKWHLSAIASVMEALARIDFETKTGQARVEVEIEQLVVKAALKIGSR